VPATNAERQKAHREKLKAHRDELKRLQPPGYVLPDWMNTTPGIGLNVLLFTLRELVRRGKSTVSRMPNALAMQFEVTEDLADEMREGHWNALERTEVLRVQGVGR